MKLLRIVSTLMIILFLVGTALSFWQFNQIGNNILGLNIIDISIFNHIEPILFKLKIVIGGTFLAGLIAIILLYINNKSQNSALSIKRKTQKEEEVNEDTNQKTIEYELDQQDLEQPIQEFNKILSTEDTFQIKLDEILSHISMKIEACIAAIYIKEIIDDKRFVTLISGFAFALPDSRKVSFEFGEGLVGQAAKQETFKRIDHVPGDYLKAFSGLGSAAPATILLIPIMSKEELLGIIELATFKNISNYEKQWLKQITSWMGENLKSQLIKIEQ